MSSLLAVVAKAVFEKQAKGLAPGDVWKTDRYASTNAALDVLTKRGALFLVTVRPNDVLWLVATLRDPKLDRTVGVRRRTKRRSATSPIGYVTSHAIRSFGTSPSV